MDNLTSSDMAVTLAGGLDEFGELVFDGVQNIIVGGSVFEFVAAEGALEFADAVKAVSGFFRADDAPKVVTLDVSVTSFAHGFHVQERSGGVFGAEVAGDAVVVAGFVAVKNHEVHSKNLAVFFGDIHDGLVVVKESFELLAQEGFGEGNVALALGVL